MGGLTGYSDLDRITVEKFLEGGVSTRSFYYHYYTGLASDADVGLAFTKIDPRAIIGFDTENAGTGYLPKTLYPEMMSRKNISELVMSSPEISTSTDGEVATLRYEYDISQIEKRN